MSKYPSHLLGKFSEEAACEFLKHHGLSFITSNYRCLLGEIDLIMRDKDVIVFIEVRARSQPNFLGALESVTKRKQSKIIKTAMFYLKQNHLLHKCVCRFDVVAVIRHEGHIECQWIKQAFEM